MNRGLADFKGEVKTMNISGEGILHFPGSSAVIAHQSNYKQTFLSFLQDTKNDSWLSASSFCHMFLTLPCYLGLIILQMIFRKNIFDFLVETSFS